MTRHLLDIGERNRDHEEGFGLIYQKHDTHDLRVHRAHINPKGNARFLRGVNALKNVFGKEK